MRTEVVTELVEAVRKELAAERERGIRRGLTVTGWEPRTIDRVVEQEREFIETGLDE